MEVNMEERVKKEIYGNLDEVVEKAVKKVFIDFYNKGLIYRGERIINWDPKAKQLYLMKK